MTTKETQLRVLVEPVVVALGLKVWGIEYLSQGKSSLVRIYIDGPEGVSVDDCARVSRQISSLFNVENPILGEYTLEVSSPGLDRPLFSLDQYPDYVGKQIAIRLRHSLEGRRRFSGRLVGVEGADIRVVVDEHDYVLPFDLIDRAVIKENSLR